MKLLSEDMICIGGKLYLFANNMNLLYTVDTNTGRFSFLGQIPDKSIFEKRLISKIILWKDTLYLIPLTCESLWTYSIVNNSWKRYEIEQYEGNWAHSFFRNAVVFNDKIFILGGYYPAIVIFDLLTEEITYIKEPFMDHHNKNSMDLYFRGDPIIINKCMYLGSCVDNSYFRFNLESYRFEWIKVGDGNNRYSGILFDNDSLWLSPRRGASSVVRKKNSGEVVEYSLKADTFPRNDYYIGIVPEPHGYFIPAAVNSTGSLKISETGIIEKIDECYSIYKKAGGVIMAQDTEGDISIIDGENKKRICSGNIDDMFFLEEMNKIAHWSGGTDIRMVESASLSFINWMAMI